MSAITTSQPNKTGDSYFRFIDVETGKATPALAKGYHLGSAYVKGDNAYVYGVNIWDKASFQNKNILYVFCICVILYLILGQYE
jgi:hypothetical protein